MDMRALPGGGPMLSVIGLGCNNFGARMDADATASVVHAALEAGITHFDTAESYGEGRSESFLGAALGSRRTEAVIATKFAVRPRGEAYEPGALRRRIVAGCEGSLRRLGTDYIDLYYQHTPDPDAPPEEALETLDELVQAGKVRALASSNASPMDLELSATIAAAQGLCPFTVTQFEWNLLDRAAERDVIPAARRRNVALIPWAPLAAGMLTGKYRRGEPFAPDTRFGKSDVYWYRASEENFDRVEALTAWASDRGHSMLDLAIAWLASHDGVVSVIAGASNADQITANVAAAQWVLSADDLIAIDEVVARQ